MTLEEPSFENFEFLNVKFMHSGWSCRSVLNPYLAGGAVWIKALVKWFFRQVWVQSLWLLLLESHIILFSEETTVTQKWMLLAYITDLKYFLSMGIKMSTICRRWLNRLIVYDISRKFLCTMTDTGTRPENRMAETL